MRRELKMQVDIRNFLYRDINCGMICLSNGAQLPLLNRRKGSQHFMNQAKFHSTFPILLLIKSLVNISGIIVYLIKNNTIISFLHILPAMKESTEFYQTYCTNCTNCTEYIHAKILVITR